MELLTVILSSLLQFWFSFSGSFQCMFLSLVFRSFTIMNFCRYVCACALFRLLLFAELLGFVVWGLGHYLFKHSFCFILFLFYFWNFIFKCIRLYPRALENILSLIFFSRCFSLCLFYWSIFMFSDSFLCCAELIILLYWVSLRWCILLWLNLSLWLFLISLFLPPSIHIVSLCSTDFYI